MSMALQIPLSIAVVTISSLGLYRSWKLKASDKTFPTLIKCICVANLVASLTYVPSVFLYSSEHPTGIWFFCQVTRSTALNFATTLGTNTALLLVYISNGSSYRTAIHTFSTTLILAYSSVPAILRLTENMVALGKYGPKFILTDTKLWDLYIIRIIDFTIAIYFIIMSGCLLYGTFRLHLKKNNMLSEAINEGKLARDAVKLSKWVMATNLAWKLILALTLSLLTYTLSNIIDLCQLFFPVHQKTWVDLLGILFLLSIGLLLELALQSSRGELNSIQNNLRAQSDDDYTSISHWPVMDAKLNGVKQLKSNDRFLYLYNRDVKMTHKRQNSPLFLKYHESQQRVSSFMPAMPTGFIGLHSSASSTKKSVG